MKELIRREKWAEAKIKAFNRMKSCIEEPDKGPHEALEWFLLFTTLDDNDHRAADYEN